MNQTAPSLSVQATIADHYPQLSGALRAAADYVVEHRFDVATRSLRSVASESELSTTSFSRMARAIGYQDYEQLRERARKELADQSSQFSNKAKKLRDDAEQPFLPHHVAACISNIDALPSASNVAELEAAVDILAGANHVALIGSLGSAALADHFAYLTSWFDGRWTVTGRNGVTLASTLMRLGPDDAVIVISKAPYARRSIMATEFAAEQGAHVIVLTDSHAFPGLRHATHSFILQSESSHFFPSYASTLVLLETIAGMLVARAGKEAIDEIRSIARINNRLDEYSNP